VNLPLLTFRNLSSIPGVVHAVSTRAGGVSEGRCESLNVSYTVDDETERVDENLRRLAHAIGTERDRFVWPYQVHGRTVTVVDANTPLREKCDVLITQSPERTLLLRYADCTPVLLADPKKNALGAVHAGWRGSAVRAASAAVEAMRDRFGSNPRDIVAGIGPAIGPCCYEVGDDVHEAFADRPWLLHERRLDLWEANRHALLEAGVPEQNVEVAGICTQCESERFFSHRANGGQPAGRFAAVIRLAC
jgi:YfiH family protein